MRSLTGHLHVFVKDVGLTEEEWGTAIELLTRTGHITDDKRQDLSGYFRRLARPAASARQPRPRRPHLTLTTRCLAHG